MVFPWIILLQIHMKWKNLNDSVVVCWDWKTHIPSCIINSQKHKKKGICLMRIIIQIYSYDFKNLLKSKLSLINNIFNLNDLKYINWLSNLEDDTKK